MILFKGVVYNLKYKDDQQVLSQKVFEDMRNNSKINDYFNKFNKINNQIIKGLDTELSSNELYRNEYGLNFKFVQKESILENVLRNLGYEYDKSWSSRSIYAINDKGERIRISNHKSIKRRYGNKERDLIFGNGIINGVELIKNGFSKINPEEEYYLY